MNVLLNVQADPLVLWMVEQTFSNTPKYEYDGWTHAWNPFTEFCAFPPPPPLFFFLNFQELPVPSADSNCGEESGRSLTAQAGRIVAADDCSITLLLNTHIPNECSKNLLSPFMKTQLVMLVIKGISFGVWPQVLLSWLWYVLGSWVYFYSDMELTGSGWVSHAAAVQEQMHYHVFQQWASAAALHLHTASSCVCHRFRGSSKRRPVLTVILLSAAVSWSFALFSYLHS